MSIISDADKETIELLRSADPMPSAQFDAPDTEAELRILLANLPQKTASRPRARRRRLSLGAAFTASTAAVVLVTNVFSGGQGALVQGGFVSPAAAAQIVRHIEQALTRYAPGQIVVSTDVGSRVGQGPRLSWTETSWESTSAPYQERFAYSTDGRSYEEGTTSQNVEQVYDPSRDTIYEPVASLDYEFSAGPRAGTHTLTVPRAVAYRAGVKLSDSQRGSEGLVVSDAQARELRAGHAVVLYFGDVRRDGQQIIGTDPKVVRSRGNVTGSGRPVPPVAWVAGIESRGVRVRLDGRTAIEVYDKSQSTTFWFAAKTYRPLKEVIELPAVSGTGKPTGGHQVTTIRTTVYRVVSGAASRRLLSVQRAHPHARIVVGELPYLSAIRRLGVS
jgi:hypothetical protein